MAENMCILPNDCSVGDVDGDGRYEIILKWDPSNAHDNAHDGYTGNVILDCYTLEGKQLWRIDLGRNIRAGAHYTQFLVYDFDGDGKAEMICKTAPGSIDGTQHFVSDAATDDEIKKVDNSAVYVNKRGRILTGEEFLTVFDGLTGKSIHTIWYNPNRALSVGGNTDYSPEWGDENGNRGERFLACAAFLDGLNKRPSAVMCRGYYTQSNLWAVDFDGKQLKTKWLHCSPSPSEWYVKDGEGNIIKQDTGLKHSAFGQGTHSVAVGDVDGDGADEIIYGSCAIDNDGSLLHSTGLGHGDALHLGDLDPDRPGLEVFMPHEAYPYGASLRDAKTGEILWRCYDKEDTGRGLTADIDSTHRGSEIWSFAERAFYSIKGEKIADIAPPANFRIYWDGDLQDELLANTRIDWRKRGRDGSPAVTKSSIQKWDGEKMVTIPFSNGKTMYEMGNSVACNGSKATPCLQADILGDWREELIEYDSENGSYLNIFTTNIPTVHRIPTLMHDHIYRMGIVWQNVTYNQPPHVGYYMGDK